MSSYIREILFINGDDGNAMVNRINRQPLGIYCNVFDGKWRDYLKFCGTNHGGDCRLPRRPCDRQQHAGARR